MRVALRTSLLSLAFLALLVVSACAAESVGGGATRPWFKNIISGGERTSTNVNEAVAKGRWFQKKTIDCERKVKNEEKKNTWFVFGRRKPNEVELTNVEVCRKNKIHPFVGRLASGWKRRVVGGRTKVLQTAKKAFKNTNKGVAAARKGSGALVGAGEPTSATTTAREAAKSAAAARPSSLRRPTTFEEWMTVIIPVGLILSLIMALCRAYIITFGEEETSKVSSAVAATAPAPAATVKTLKSLKSERSLMDVTALTINESDEDDEDSIESEAEGCCESSKVTTVPATETTATTSIPHTPPPSPIITSRAAIEVDPAGLEACIQQAAAQGEVSPLVAEEECSPAESVDDDDEDNDGEEEKKDEDITGAGSVLPIQEVGHQPTKARSPVVPIKEEDHDSDSDKDEEEDSDSDEDDDENEEETLALIAALEEEAAARAREAEEAIGKAESAVGEIDDSFEGNESARELRMSLRRSSSMLRLATPE